MLVLFFPRLCGLYHLLYVLKMLVQRLSQILLFVPYVILLSFLMKNIFQGLAYMALFPLYIELHHISSKYNLLSLLSKSGIKKKKYFIPHCLQDNVQILSFLHLKSCTLFSFTFLCIFSLRQKSLTHSTLHFIHIQICIILQQKIVVMVQV